MVWRAEREGQASWLVGTAHFFPESFADSLEEILEGASTAAMEGPLDPESLDRIAAHGRDGDGTPVLADLLGPDALAELDRKLFERIGGRGFDLRSLLFRRPDPHPLRSLTRGLRPWMAYFSVWTACLGWEHSVDREGYEIARRLGLEIHWLGTLEEQLEVLAGIPFERVVRQLNDVRRWPEYTERYRSRYLAGDLTGLLDLAQTFHMRRRPLTTARDRKLFTRIRSLYEAGPTVAFVGFPHVPGIAKMLTDDGYRVTRGCGC
jgi:uncharacterized protein YbaP (TraB family)